MEGQSPCNKQMVSFYQFDLLKKKKTKAAEHIVVLDGSTEGSKICDITITILSSTTSKIKSHISVENSRQVDCRIFKAA